MREESIPPKGGLVVNNLVIECIRNYRSWRQGKGMWLALGLNSQQQLFPRIQTQPPVSRVALDFISGYELRRITGTPGPEYIQGNQAPWKG